jgi:hypothetical protein
MPKDIRTQKHHMKIRLMFRHFYFSLPDSKKYKYVNKQLKLQNLRYMFKMTTLNVHPAIYVNEICILH